MPFDLDPATIIPIVLAILGCNLIVLMVMLSFGPVRRRAERLGPQLLWAGRAGLAETLGTFLLVFVAMLGLPQGAYVCGLLLAVLVAALGPTSGAHLNPAVTLGLTAVGRCHPLAAVWFIAAQMGGAVGAAALQQHLFGPERLALPPAGPLPPTTVLILEGIGTGLLMMAVFGTCCRDETSKAQAPLAIGGGLCVALLVVGPYTGGILNPARYFGPALLTQDYGPWLVYLAGPCLGAMLMAAICQMLVTEVPAKKEIEIEEPVGPRLYDEERQAA